MSWIPKFDVNLTKEGLSEIEALVTRDVPAVLLESLLPATMKAEQLLPKAPERTGMPSRPEHQPVVLLSACATTPLAKPRLRLRREVL